MNYEKLKNAIKRKLMLDNEKEQDEEISEIVSLFDRCELWVENTGSFTKTRGWNTYSSILHLKVPMEKENVFNNNKEKILEIADSIYGNNKGNFLMYVNIDILLNDNDDIDLSELQVTEVTQKAIEVAMLHIDKGEYDLAVDRVHTALMGYFRKILENKNIEFDEGDTLSQLYNKLHSSFEELSDREYGDLVKTIIRGMTGIISSINEIRNKYSLSHPNKQIVSEKEAKLAINNAINIVQYIKGFI